MTGRFIRSFIDCISAAVSNFCLGRVCVCVSETTCMEKRDHNANQPTPATTTMPDDKTQDKTTEKTSQNNDESVINDTICYQKNCISSTVVITRQPMSFITTALIIFYCIYVGCI